MRTFERFQKQDGELHWEGAFNQRRKEMYTSKICGREYTATMCYIAYQLIKKM